MANHDNDHQAHIEGYSDGYLGLEVDQANYGNRVYQKGYKDGYKDRQVHYLAACYTTVDDEF